MDLVLPKLLLVTAALHVAFAGLVDVNKCKLNDRNTICLQFTYLH